MPDLTPVVFLLDVDNTLLDNDRIAADLRRHLEHEVGHERQERYWAIFEELRTELGYADYLGALQRYRIEHPRDPHLLTVSAFLIDYPFANRLYPNSLEHIGDLLERDLPSLLAAGAGSLMTIHPSHGARLLKAFGADLRDHCEPRRVPRKLAA